MCILMENTMILLTPQYGNHNIQNALAVITISYLEKWMLIILKKL